MWELKDFPAALNELEKIAQEKRISSYFGFEELSSDSDESDVQSFIPPESTENTLKSYDLLQNSLGIFNHSHSSLDQDVKIS